MAENLPALNIDSAHETEVVTLHGQVTDIDEECGWILWHDLKIYIFPLHDYKKWGDKEKETFRLVPIPYIPIVDEIVEFNLERRPVAKTGMKDQEKTLLHASIEPEAIVSICWWVKPLMNATHRAIDDIFSPSNN